MASDIFDKSSRIDLVKDRFGNLVVKDIETIKNVSDVLRAIKLMIDADRKNDIDKGNTLCEYYFRGETKNHDKILGATFRSNFDCSLDRDDVLWRNEKALYHRAYQVNPDAFSEDKTMIERLTRMQHYHLPTRFADLSKNVLQALFFAVEDAPRKKAKDLSDGVVRIFKIHPDKMKYFSSDVITAISHLPLLNPDQLDFSKDLGYLYHAIKVEQPGFSARSWLTDELKRDIQQVWAFQPAWNNARIRFQEGIFLAFGCRNHKEPLHPSFSREDFDKFPQDDKTAKSAPSCGIMQLGYVKISKDYKKPIAEDLRYCGVLAEMVYPDLSDSCTAIHERFLTSSEDELDRESANPRFWEGLNDYWRRRYNCENLLRAYKGNTNGNSDLRVTRRNSYHLSLTLVGKEKVSLVIVAHGAEKRKDLTKQKDIIEKYLSEKWRASSDWISEKYSDKSDGYKRVVFSYSFEYATRKGSFVEIYTELFAALCRLIKGLMEAKFEPTTISDELRSFVEQVE